MRSSVRRVTSVTAVAPRSLPINIPWSVAWSRNLLQRLSRDSFWYLFWFTKNGVSRYTVAGCWQLSVRQILIEHSIPPTAVPTISVVYLGYSGATGRRSSSGLPHGQLHGVDKVALCSLRTLHRELLGSEFNSAGRRSQWIWYRDHGTGTRTRRHHTGGSCRGAMAATEPTLSRCRVVEALGV